MKRELRIFLGVLFSVLWISAAQGDAKNCGVCEGILEGRYMTYQTDGRADLAVCSKCEVSATRCQLCRVPLSRRGHAGGEALCHSCARDAIRCEEARMSRYGSTKSVSRVRKWRSRPRGVDLSVIWRLIFARNDADRKSDWLPADWVETHLESPNRRTGGPERSKTAWIAKKNASIGALDRHFLSRTNTLESHTR